MAANFPNVDLSNPRQFKSAVDNIRNLYNATPEQVRRTGAQWYDRVNEATAKGVRGTQMSTLSGAGLVAAVSPNMDWERNNIDAFKELHSLKGGDWASIADSAAGRSRSGEASRVLNGLSISTTSDANLIKARRIMDGEHTDDVLSRRTAPKTNSFAHNIAEPQTNGHVTIDGRAHDIAANRLQPWTSNRGIGSAALPTGKTTRYEHFENAYRSAAQSLAEQHGVLHLPHQLQAVVWEGGKGIERAGTTKKGTPRLKGVSRVGQQYL
jgi:hypothetical protein